MADAVKEALPLQGAGAGAVLPSKAAEVRGALRVPSQLRCAVGLEPRPSLSRKRRRRGPWAWRTCC